MAAKEKLANLKSLDDRRLWIGNLDSRVNEYQLLKLTEKFGKIQKFDLLYHRFGPQANKPRGYAFVTYERAEDALEAKIHLDRKLVGCKYIAVTWAHCMPVLLEPDKKELSIPALAIATKKQAVSREQQIEAIEAKLNMMSSKSTDLIINKSLATEPPIVQLKPPEPKQGPQKPRSRTNYIPYNRSKRK